MTDVTDMTDIRKRRGLLREVNQQIRGVNASFGTHGSLLILCECERAECFQRIDVPEHIYDEVREDGERFVVVTGHEDSDVERITAGPEGYSIVRVPWRGLQTLETDDGRLPDAPTRLTGPSPLPAA